MGQFTFIETLLGYENIAGIMTVLRLIHRFILEKTFFKFPIVRQVLWCFRTLPSNIWEFQIHSDVAQLLKSSPKSNESIIILKLLTICPELLMGAQKFYFKIHSKE